MNTILKYTKRSQQQYESIIFDLWFNWCNLNAKHFQEGVPEQEPLEFQKLLANAPLNRWWRRELTQLELAFVNEAREYIPYSEKGTIRALYHSHIVKIMHIYPKALINKARKSNTKTQ